MPGYQHPETKKFISRAEAIKLGLVADPLAKTGDAGSGPAVSGETVVTYQRVRGRIIRREAAVAKSD